MKTEAQHIQNVVQYLVKAGKRPSAVPEAATSADISVALSSAPETLFARLRVAGGSLPAQYAAAHCCSSQQPSETHSFFNH